MRDTVVGDGLRWYIVAAAFVGATAMLLSFVHEWRRRDRTRDWIDAFAEAAALLGGFGTCFFIGFGTLGVLYGWDSALRLPGLAASLTFTAVGRGIQFWRRWSSVASGVSYNGWPANSAPSAIGIVPFHPLGVTGFRNGGFPTGIKGGDVAAVFTYLVERLHAEAEPMLADPATGQLGYGCWSYEYRANVNNPSQLSCHASGTAIDYNAPKHPNGTSVASGRSGWSLRGVAAVRAILADLGGVVRWLEGNDPMHFEVHGSPAQVSEIAGKIRRLAANVDDSASTPPTPTPDPPSAPQPSEEDDMFTDDNGRALNLAANGGYTYRLVRDSDDPTGPTYAFGPGVFYWVTSDQHLAYLRQAGLVSSDDKDVLVKNHDLVGLIRQECARGIEELQAKPEVPETAWYTVQPGDTLSGIAANYGIPDWHTIATLNGITDPQSIQPNDKIRVK